KDKIVSYSPNCGWAPHKDSGRALDKFGFYVDREHGGNYRAAIEALAREYGLWVEPQKAQEAPQEALSAEEIERRRKDAQRKREARQRHATELREHLLGRAAIDEDMPEQSRRMLDIHLTIAGQRGWHRASVARMAELAGYGERWVQRANEYLVEQGYIER